MQAALNYLALCLLFCASVQGAVPANEEARSAAANGTAAGEEALSFLGTSNATLIALADYFNDAHAAAEASYATAYAGQQSGTLGSVGAGGATLLAAAVALNNDSSSQENAQAELANANTLIAGIVDENPIQNSNATNANLLLLYQIGHDGTLAQYWQNLTGGEAGDNATFAETIEFVAELAGAASERLEAGASPALVSIATEMVARNILSAIYVYQGNNMAAYQEGLAEARLILKAVNVVQSGASCGGEDTANYLMQLNMAIEAATTAAESLTEADIQTAADSATAIVNSQSRCASVAPAIAPASVAAASTGRKML